MALRLAVSLRPCVARVAGMCHIAGRWHGPWHGRWDVLLTVETVVGPFVVRLQSITAKGHRLGKVRFWSESKCHRIYGTLFWKGNYAGGVFFIHGNFGKTTPFQRTTRFL